MIFKGYLFSFLWVFCSIGLLTLIGKLTNMNKEISRKIIHTLVGFTWLPLYFYLKNTIHIVIIPVIFTAINYLSCRFSLFKFMERENTDGKKDWGTVYFAICMTLLALFSLMYLPCLIPFGISVFCLSFGDGAAALAGTLIKHKIMLMKDKSLVGTVSCFFASIAGIYLLSAIIGLDIPLFKVLVFSALTAFLELIGGKLDNFTVSFGITFAAMLIL